MLDKVTQKIQTAIYLFVFTQLQLNLSIQKVSTSFAFPLDFDCNQQIICGSLFPLILCHEQRYYFIANTA